MTFTSEQTAALSAPLSKANVKKNPKGFDYVEAWHAIAEANRIFGHDGWTRETVMLTETNRDLVDLKSSNGPYQQWRVGYIAKVKIAAGGVVREGTGYGSGMSKPEALGDAIEGAVKEAESDAMKRALMTFGNPFGLALYDKTQANVVKEPPPGVITGTDLAEELASNLLKGCGSKELLKDAWDKNEAGWKKVLDEPSYLRVKGLCIHLVKQFDEPQREAA